MISKKTDVLWDDAPVDVSTEVNFIWSIANKLRGTYQSDKYKDVIIPMVIIRRVLPSVGFHRLLRYYDPD